MRQANRFRVRFWHRRRVSVFGIGHGNIGGWVRAKEEAWVFGLVYTQNVREKFARFFIAIVYGGISNIQHCIAVAVDVAAAAVAYVAVAATTWLSMATPNKARPKTTRNGQRDLHICHLHLHLLLRQSAFPPRFDCG